MKAIFVHLGIEKADHLWLNLKRLKSIFPEVSVVIILDEERHLKRLKDLDVETFVYSRTEYRGYQLGELNHDKEFRNGFWRFTIERFMALTYWHESYPNESFVHLESDVAVMPDFPWEKIDKLNTLAWLRFNDVKDVAAIMYSPNPEATRWLSDLLSDEFARNPELTDMTALSLISRANPKRVTILPTLMTKHNPINFKNRVPEYNESEKGIEFFGGMFDGAAVGMWLTGQDPRNHLGWIKRYISLPESDVDPSLLKIEIFNKSQLTAEYQGRIVSLFNLHIHSKQLSYFGSRWRSRLQADINSSKFQRHSQRLSLRVTSTIFRKYLAKNQFLNRNSIRVLKNFFVASRKD